MEHPALDQEEISAFHANGFLSLPRLVDDLSLEAIREIYDQLLSGELDTTGSRDDYLGDVTRQLVGPEHCHALFRSNAALDAGREIASQLFDWEPVFLYSQRRHAALHAGQPLHAAAASLHLQLCRSCVRRAPLAFGP